MACGLVLSPRAEAEWNFSGYIGSVHTQNSTLSLQALSATTDLRFHDVKWAGESFRGPLYYGVRGGYFFSRHFGLEAEFIHMKVFAPTQRTVVADGVLRGASVSGAMPMNAVVERFNISHGNNLLLGNFVVRQDFWRDDDRLGRVIVSARVGFGGSIPHPESTVLGVSDEHYQGGSPAGQVAAGVELRLLRHLYWMGEYKLTRNRQHVRVAGDGTAAAAFNSHHVVTGVAVHF